MGMRRFEIMSGGLSTHAVMIPSRAEIAHLYDVYDTPISILIPMFRLQYIYPDHIIIYTSHQCEYSELSASYISVIGMQSLINGIFTL